MSTAGFAAAQVLLADDDKDRGSPIGLFVVLILCIAVYFLWKSLNRHIKRVPESFDPPPTGDPAARVPVSGVDPTSMSTTAKPAAAAGSAAPAESQAQEKPKDARGPDPDRP
ncbi:hypothetical protein ACSMXN_04330 [Jatrophihabitans sp. DSM 45814]